MAKNYTIDLTKGEIIQLMVKVLFWFCLPLTIYSWSRYFKVGFLPVMVLHGFLLLTLFVVFLKKESISQKVQAHVIIWIFLGIAFGAIPTRGDLIYGIPGGIFAIAFAASLFNAKVAYRYLALQVVVVLFLGLTFGQEEKRFQSIFELVSYSAFQFFLIISLSKVSNYLSAMIEELNEAINAKSRFLAMMSHEIRTPLNGIVMASESLIEEDDRESSVELTQIIFNSSKALKAIVDDVLDFSKLEEDKISINFRVFDFQTLIKNIFQEFKIQNKSSSITFSITNPENIVFIYSDPHRLDQILRNLISNALKFTSRGEISLNIATVDNCQELKIEVRDTGIGINEDRLDKVFEEFEQETNLTSREFGGTGLGLAIVKRLTQKLGGKIEVSSKKGEGSCFSIYLPYNLDVIEGERRQNPDDQQSVKKNLVCSADLTKKILIVEDNDINITVLSKRLTKLGFKNISAAKDGALALEQLNINRFDIVFMDVHMPVMDGLEATQKIREGSAGKLNVEIPIIGLSANSFAEDIKCGKEAGMNDYLGKPLSLNGLIQILNKYL